MTKVTYNMYSCDTCCMSIEMIEMDGLDRAKCQIVKGRDINGIIEMLMNETKVK